MLVIDDEADNASINTNKPDINPTATNAWIRKILRLFTKNCYVGYTATPFANIFIDPDAFDKDAYEELFPSDFIHSLDAPTTYFGPDKVFLNDESSSAILRQINDCEEYLPFVHKNGFPVAELPPSLYRALDQFIVARAIRNLRGQERKHCSMLVNVSRFVSVQKEVRSFIGLRLDRISVVSVRFLIRRRYWPLRWPICGAGRRFWQGGTLACFHRRKFAACLASFMFCACSIRTP